ncbi:hypothetical protein FHL15_008679 [Xylaria flabelliformis]|uniref:Uncharacterized protein n=1 Tax=Xylaria flabelliformis TaxID=2512241 RepID=A0A553HRF5_9PEZI|nr:hypothetical protein FHL15_008679 [Xylaria flabelliformis]
MSLPRVTTKWDPNVHEDILVAINDVLKLTREDWARVIQALHAMGHSFTESALNADLGGDPSPPLYYTPNLFSSHFLLDLQPGFCSDNFSIPTYTVDIVPSHLHYSYQDSAMTTNAGGQTIWSDKTRSDLLQAIFDVCPPSKHWEAISVQLREKGYTYSYSAALQHLQKLKKKEGDKKNEKNEDEQATPKKAKAAAGRAKKTGGIPGTPSQKKRNRMNADMDEDEDEVKVKKLKFEPQAPNLGQYYEDEPNPPSDGEI